jgi:hypothetical protein
MSTIGGVLIQAYRITKPSTSYKKRLPDGIDSYGRRLCDKVALLFKQRQRLVSGPTGP